MSAILHKYLALRQPEKGYRYNIDSLLLARFMKIHAQEVLCDLGAGVGVLGLVALAQGKARHLISVEVQAELAAYILENAKLLQVDAKVEVVVANWRNLKRKHLAKTCDVVMSNPPYRKAGSGKSPPDSSKAIAKHELLGAMPDLIEAARFLLKPEGRLYLMYPPLRLEEMVQELAKAKLKIQRLACIHPYGDRPATLCLVEAVRSAVRELRVDPPIVVYQDVEHYTPEIEAWVGPKRRV